MRRARLPEVNLQIGSTVDEDERIYAWESLDPIRIYNLLSISDGYSGCGFLTSSRLTFVPPDIDVSEWKAFGLEYGGYGDRL